MGIGKGKREETNESIDCVKTGKRLILPKEIRVHQESIKTRTILVYILAITCSERST